MYLERRDAAGEVVDKISEVERDSAVAKLGILWFQLGFELFGDEVWILDLGSRTVRDRIEVICESLGLG